MNTELKLRSTGDQAEAMIQASGAIFGRDYNEALIHQVVVAFQANARGANSKQKSRNEVAYSTRKPWRQKGTGRSRAGTRGSPVWRGGGRAFPNTGLENYSQKVNRKMYRAGMCSILSQLVRDDRLSVIDELTLEAPRTKLLAQKLKELGLASVLILTEEYDENLYLASRNLPNVLVLQPHQADPVSLIFYQDVLITRAALARMEEMLS